MAADDKESFTLKYLHCPHLPLRHKQTPVCAAFNHEGPASAWMFSLNTWVAASTLAISTAAILGHTSLLVLWLVRDLKKETPAECSSVRNGRFSLYQENRSWGKKKPVLHLNRESLAHSHHSSFKWPKQDNLFFLKRVGAQVAAVT